MESADVYLPPDFDDGKKYAAIVSTHPIGSCKEQTSGSIYAAALAREGFVVVAFDASFQGATVVIGDKPGGFGAYRDGCEIHARAASKKKELVVAKGWSHYDLYDKPEPVGLALAKAVPFFRENL